MVSLDPDQLESFRTRGFLVIRGLFARHEMREWKRRIIDDKAMKSEDTLGNNAQSSGVSVWMADAAPDYFVQRLCTGRMAQVLTQLIGPCEFLSTKPVLKTGMITFPSPWHQDYGKHFRRSLLLHDLTTLWKLIGMAVPRRASGLQ